MSRSIVSFSFSSPIRPPWYTEAPFQVWNFYKSYNSVKKLGLSSDSLEKTLLPETSGRLETKLQKTLQGYRLKMAVIGGSHTAGGGIEHINHAYQNLLADWYNKIVKPNTGSSLENILIAIGGTGSDFFGFCLANFVPNDVDIVLVELSTNDDGTKYGSAVAPMEKLTRRILNLPSAPAIIYIQIVGNLGVNKYAGKILNPQCKNLEDYGQNELVKHYGIAGIRWREIVCPTTTAKHRTHKSISELTESKMISRDGLHVGDLGHAQIAYLVITYFQSIFARLIANRTPIADSGSGDVEEGSSGSEQDYTPPLPPPRFYMETVDDSAPPLCWTLLTPDFHHGLFPQTLYTKVTSNKGFYYVPPDAKKFNAMHGNGRQDSFCSWATGKINSHITFGFTIPPANSLSPFVTTQGRSLSLVVRENDVGTEASVWIDNRKDEAKKINSERFEGESHVHPLATNVPPGYHQITVWTTGKGSFHVSGIIVGPKEFNGYSHYRQYLK